MLQIIGTRRARQAVVYAAAMGCIVVGLLAAQSAYAEQRYAEVGGDGPAASCLQSDPCSIVDVLNPTFTEDGDEVILNAGTYDIGPNDFSTSEAVDIRGVGGGTIVTSSGSFTGILNNVNARMRFMRIINTDGGKGVELFNGKLENVTVITAGTACSGGANTLIRDSFCISTGSGGIGVRLASSGGTNLLKLRNVTAIGKDSSSYGIELFSSGGAQNTIDARAVIANGGDADLRVSSSDAGTVGTMTMTNSNFFDTSIFTSGGGSSSATANNANGNVSAAPLFVQPATNDYHQQIGSPTIDQGSADADSGGTDIDGESRPMGLAMDIGADEIDNQAPPPPTITTPTNPTVSTNLLPTVIGTAEFGSSVSILVDGVEVGTDTADPNWSFNLIVPLTEGAHEITATATDIFNNESAPSGSVDFIVDTTAPTVSISAPTNGGATSDNTPIIAFAVTEANPATTTCAVDGGAPFTCAPGDALPALADGSHTLVIEHKDDVDQTGTASSTFSVDSTAPQTTITKKPKRKSTKRSVTFAFTASEPGSTFKCKIDKAPLRACKAKFSKKFKPGKHKITVFATDQLGNQDATPATYSFTIKKPKR